jgi:hypothetical protein
MGKKSKKAAAGTREEPFVLYERPDDGWVAWEIMEALDGPKICVSGYHPALPQDGGDPNDIILHIVVGTRHEYVARLSYSGTRDEVLGWQEE